MIVTRFQNVVRLLSMRRHLGSRFFLGILILVILPVDSAAAAKPNIILITLDSARADRMGFMGSRSGLTPQSGWNCASGIGFCAGLCPSAHHSGLRRDHSYGHLSPDTSGK